MGIAQLEKYSSFAKSLEQNDQKKARALKENKCVKQHRKRSRFKVQTADKLSKAVSTWQRKTVIQQGIQGKSHT